MTEKCNDTPNVESDVPNVEEIYPPQEDTVVGSPDQSNDVPMAESVDQNDHIPTVESVIEAVLFASDEPLTEAKLAAIVETGVKQLRQHISNLNAKYKASSHAFQIEQIAGGYQMLTLSPYNHWIKRLCRVRKDTKLSPAALETLAIIAYKQPVIRADIEAIRGVAVGDIVRSLMEKGLVRVAGRAEVLGRPMLYGTTKKFLEVFGLNSLKDLPKADELKKPEQITSQWPAATSPDEPDASAD
jgi:segregation and condensation protein B